MSDLDDRLLAAHELGDRAALVALYTEAAMATAEDQARGFFLTHAYVFALDLGSAEAQSLRDQLISMGRESPL